MSYARMGINSPPNGDLKIRRGALASTYFVRSNGGPQYFTQLNIFQALNMAVATHKCRSRWYQGVLVAQSGI